MKYKNIIGGTEEDAEEKFPWLKDADFENAEIDIVETWLIWKDGTWKKGVWENGIWQGGIWQDGTWEGGKMWSNRQQKYIRVLQKDGKFEETQEKED